MKGKVLIGALLMAGGATTRADAQITVRSGSGANAAAIAAVRDQFRADIGGGTVAGANGSFGGRRREINWDGVPATSAAPNVLAANFFNVTSPRGVVYSTPGTYFEVSSATSDAGVGQPAAPNFGDINPGYVTTFQTFSPQRLFTPVGSNIFDVQFFVAGTGIAATVKGFGLVLTDVDVASTTAVQFFDAGSNSLGKVFAPALGGGLSFVGGFVTRGPVRIARVRVTLGNTTIGPGDNNASSDIVVADDFIYGEPLDVVFADGFE